MDNLLHDVFSKGFQGDLFTVLACHDNSVNSVRSLVKDIFTADLCLGIRSSPPKSAISPQIRDLVHLVGQNEGEGHALLCFVGGITKHETLGGKIILIQKA